MYLADSVYHKQKAGKYSNEDFTGFLLIFDNNRKLKDTLAALNGRIIGKASMRRVERPSGGLVTPRGCGAGYYTKTDLVQGPCPPNCACINNLCYYELTTCVLAGGGTSGLFPPLTFIDPLDPNTYNTHHTDPSGGGGAVNMNLFSAENEAMYNLVTVAGLSATTVNRFKASYYSEFLFLGKLVKDNGAQASLFALNYMAGVLTRQFTQLDDYFKIGEAYRVLYDVENQELFNQVMVYLIAGQFNDESTEFSVLHISLMKNNEEYRLLIQEALYPRDFIGYVKPFINPLNECKCKTISYRIESNNVVITSNYTVGGGLFNGPSMQTTGHMAVIPRDHPHRDKLQIILAQVNDLKRKNIPPNGENTWVYRLEGLSKNPDILKCRSCDPIITMWLEKGLTYKFGTAKDKGTFQQSILDRYSGEYSLYGFTGFQFNNSIPVPNANVFASSMSTFALPKSAALLLEKILIFNYTLTGLERPTDLWSRGIQTQYGLPPGNTRYK
jgi:hypothetical protein